MTGQREQAENPTQGMNRPEPSGDEPMDLSEPEDLGESSPFAPFLSPVTSSEPNVSKGCGGPKRM